MDSSPEESLPKSLSYVVKNPRQVTFDFSEDTRYVLGSTVLRSFERCYSHLIGIQSEDHERTTAVPLAHVYRLPTLHTQLGIRYRTVLLLLSVLANVALLLAHSGY